jgi:peptidoglycan/xylan/chitin deacetylase (PgdA/CDA1 family)
MLQSDPERAREATDSLLKLFAKYDIPATWAIVGHLLLDVNDAQKSVHQEMPQFKEGWIDWEFYNALRNNRLYYSKDIVKRILTSHVKHEIGLHGFLHIPFSQCSLEVANAETESGIEAANNLGITLKSFVFPGNYVGHVNALKKHGFQIYREEDLRWWSKDQKSLIRKFDSAAHTIIGTPASLSCNSGIWETSGSIFCDPQLPFTVPWRARLGLYRAIQSKKVFHIWLHPWHLLLYKILKKDLEEFLALVAQKRDEDKLQVMTMGELASHLNQEITKPNKKAPSKNRKRGQDAGN